MKPKARRAFGRVGPFNNTFASLLTSPIIDSFLVSQCYAIIVLPNGGPDLEAYRFINPTKVGWRQASSLFWQVAKSLSLAEQLVSFEVGFSSP